MIIQMVNTSEGDNARLEKKLLRKIACATKERESCLEYDVGQR